MESEEGSGSALKWIVAVVGLTVVVIMSAPAALQAIAGSVVLERSEPPLPPLPTAAASAPPEPVEDGAAVASVDFMVAQRVVQASQEPSVTVAGPDQALVAAFPLIEGSDECIASVLLEVSLTGTDGEGRIGVYPSGVFTPMALGDGDGAIPQLTASPAAVAVTDGSLGRLRWDVTDLYLTWVDGAAFGDISIPGGVPFTIAVRGTDETPTALTFATTEAGEQAAPAITWAGAPECG